MFLFINFILVTNFVVLYLDFFNGIVQNSMISIKPFHKNKYFSFSILLDLEVRGFLWTIVFWKSVEKLEENFMKQI